MQFKHETGAIIGPENGLISIFDGEVGHVDFPDEMIAKIHRLNPGHINRFTHTHPPGMFRPSQQDNSMMSNLAVSMYPFPVRLGIIVPETIEELKEKEASLWSSKTNSHIFVENVYQWIFEPREVWQMKKMVQNDIKRAIVFQRIDTKMINYVQGENRSWEDWIIERSY